jgi:hypothetical protein
MIVGEYFRRKYKAKVEINKLVGEMDEVILKFKQLAMGKIEDKNMLELEYHELVGKIDELQVKKYLKLSNDYGEPLDGVSYLYEKVTKNIDTYLEKEKHEPYVELSKIKRRVEQKRGSYGKYTKWLYLGSAIMLGAVLGG